MGPDCAVFSCTRSQWSAQFSIVLRQVNPVTMASKHPNCDYMYLRYGAIASEQQRPSPLVSWKRPMLPLQCPNHQVQQFSYHWVLLYGLIPPTFPLIIGIEWMIWMEFLIFFSLAIEHTHCIRHIPKTFQPPQPGGSCVITLVDWWFLLPIVQVALKGGE